MLSIGYCGYSDPVQKIFRPSYCWNVSMSAVTPPLTVFLWDMAWKDDGIAAVNICIPLLMILQVSD